MWVSANLFAMLGVEPLLGVVGDSWVERAIGSLHVNQTDVDETCSTPRETGIDPGTLAMGALRRRRASTRARRTGRAGTQTSVLESSGRNPGGMTPTQVDPMTALRHE